MNIRQVTDGKEDYIELLRMGDPDEYRIRKVLEKKKKSLLAEAEGYEVNFFYLKNMENSVHCVWLYFRKKRNVR